MGVGEGLLLLEVGIDLCCVVVVGCADDDEEEEEGGAAAVAAILRTMSELPHT